jgi:hypothetical protein
MKKLRKERNDINNRIKGFLLNDYLQQNYRLQRGCSSKASANFFIGYLFYKESVQQFS